MNGHTAGPWEVTRDSMSLRLQAIQSSTRKPICRVDWQVVGDKDPEAGLNARLLALAPTAPHDCDIPGCPGAENKRRLAQMTEALIAIGASGTCGPRCRGAEIAVGALSEEEGKLSRRLAAFDEMLAALRTVKADREYQRLHGAPHFTSAPTEMDWKRESAEKAWGMVDAAIAKAER